MVNSFSTQVEQIASKRIIRIPIEISRTFPSRGMVMAQCSIQDRSYAVPLEPDGHESHWFEVTEDMGIEEGKGEMVQIRIEPLQDWQEPVLPTDMVQAIELAGVNIEFQSLTPKAKWDWLRWIRSTKNIETRNKRIEVMISKLQKGDRRPCCFNRNICTVTEVSKNGILVSKED